MKKQKEFSCSNECNSNCCSYTVIKAILPAFEHYDDKYMMLHGIEYTYKDFEVKKIEELLEQAIKKSKLPKAATRILKPTLMSVMKTIFRTAHFKIPTACEWLDQNTGKCRHYQDRPEICKKSAAANKDNPYAIKNCPYME